MKIELEKLRHGEHYTAPQSDHGKAEIYRLHDRYILFEIPMFGGQPQYAGTFHINQIDKIITIIDNWA